MSSTRSPLASATLPPPSLATWTTSSPVSTGKRASFILDDIIVFAATWEEHLDRLRQVFERLRHAKLKLGADKCTLAAREVSYLGHRVTEEGLLPDPSLLATIREISPPKNATEVGSFLGLAGYYQRYVKNFTAIAGPLHALTRKDVVCHWSPDCQDAFDRLKTLLTTSPITAFPDFSLPFRLYTGRADSRSRRNPRSSPERQGAHHLLCLALPQPGGKSLSRHQIGMSRHSLGRRKVPTLFDVNAI